MKNIKTILIAVLSFMLLFSVSCKNEDKTGGDGGVYDNPDIEYGQFLPPESSYTGKNYGVSSSETTIQVVKNSDGTCNLKGKVTLSDFILEPHIH